MSNAKGHAFQLTNIDPDLMAIIRARAAFLQKPIGDYLREIINDYHKDFSVHNLGITTEK